MKDISGIQKLCRVLKRILNTVSVVFYLFLTAVVSAIALWLIFGKRYLNGETTVFYMILEAIDNANFESTLVLLMSDLVYCIGKITVLRLAVSYLKRELSDGTPYTRGGARKLRSVGIGIVAASFASQIAILTLCGIYSLTSVYRIEVGTVIVGVLLIFFSLVLKHASVGQEEEVESMVE